MRPSYLNFQYLSRFHIVSDDLAVPVCIDNFGVTYIEHFICAAHAHAL